MHGAASKPSLPAAKLTVAALALAIIPGIIALLYLEHARPTATDSVAVLPFSGASADGDASALGAEVTKEVTAELSRVPHLDVISPDPASGGPDTDPGTHMILRGTVTRRAATIEVDAELLDENTKGLLWSRQYHRNNNNTSGIAGEVAADIAASVKEHVAAGK